MAASKQTALTAAGSSPSSSLRKHKEFLKTLSLYEKVDYIPAYFLVLANAVTAFLTGPIRSKDTRHPSLFYHVLLTAFRTLTRRLSARQIAASGPHTDETYKTICKKHNYEPKSEVLEDGTVAHWIGDQKAEKIILNFHGGGYVVPATPDLFEFMFQMIEILRKEGKNVSCLFLSYDLATTSPYPRQLSQAALLLKHTITTLSHAPSTILLTGDSAGGNLVLSLLSHLAHPHPRAVENSIPTIKLEEPLAGATLICPWLGFDDESKQKAKKAGTEGIKSSSSTRRNVYKDIISTAGTKSWSEAFLGGTVAEKGDEYNEPVRASPEWWAGVKDVVNEVFVVVGGGEVLLDSTLTTASNIKAGMGADKVQVFIAEGEFHEQLSIDLGLGVQVGGEKEGQMSRKVRGWVGSKL